MFDKFAQDLFAVGKFTNNKDTKKVSDTPTSQYDQQYSIMDFAKDNPIPVGAMTLILIKALKRSK